MAEKDEQQGAAFQDLERLVQEEEAGAEEADAPGDGQTEQLSRLSEGLGKEIQPSTRYQAGPEAGMDADRWFYRVQAGGLALGLREDSMKVYLIGVSARLKVSEIEDQLGKCNLADVQVPPPEEFKAALQKKMWVPVAEGRPARKAEWTAFCTPGEPEQVVSADVLALMSVQLEALFQAEVFNEEAVREIRGLAAMPGEVIARVHRKSEDQPGQDVFGRELPLDEAEASRPEAGDCVACETHEYKATKYGYVCLSNNRLSVLPPFWMGPLAVQVYGCVLDERPRPVTREMVGAWFQALKIKEGADMEGVDAFVGQTAGGGHQGTACLLAAGKEPAPGQDAEIEMLVDTERKAGVEREDGSIDFREVNFAPDVKTDQPVARRRPPTRGTPGRNVKGQVCPAEDGENHPLEAGSHVQKRVEEGGVEEFVAKTEGALKRRGNKIWVVEMLRIDGNVGFNTGNLNFGGDIYVKGSIGPGFSVRAGGDVVIAGTVEGGATVVSQGNVTVGKGIVGRKTKVTALGNIRAQFVNEATVQTARNILLGNYAMQPFLRAGGIKVSKGEGRRGGSIVGGETWGLKGIDLFFAGNAASTRTVLNAGMDLTQAQKLDDLNQKIKEGSKQVQRILDRFGLVQVDVAQIQNMLAASTGARRKVLAGAARKLGELVQANQKLIMEKKEVEEKATTGLEAAVIIVRSTAFPGVQIRLGEYRRAIQQEITSPRFHLEQGELAEV